MNNTQLFLINNQFKDEISFIEKELSEYLYPFPESERWEHREQEIY